MKSFLQKASVALLLFSACHQNQAEVNAYKAAELDFHRISSEADRAARAGRFTPEGAVQVFSAVVAANRLLAMARDALIAADRRQAALATTAALSILAEATSLLEHIPPAAAEPAEGEKGKEKK